MILFHLAFSHVLLDLTLKKNFSSKIARKEDCEYMGELVYISPPGSIRTKDKCEDLCMDFEFLNCNYWSFVKSSSTCYLYTSQDRNCQAIGGPQKPNITECMSKDEI